MQLPGYTAAELLLTDVLTIRNFTVGDGYTYGTYINQELQRDATYTVFYVVASSLDGVTKMSYSQIVSPVTPGSQPTIIETTTRSIISSTSVVSSSSTSVVGAIGSTRPLSGGAIAGIAVFLLILLLIGLVLLLLYCCWWKKRTKSTDDIDTTWLSTNYPTLLSSPTAQKWSNIYSLQDAARYIILENVGPADLNVTDIHNNRPKISFEDEYRKLAGGSKYPCTAANRPGDEGKNRFEHLLAYDHSRVVLNDNDNSSSSSDYINANYIPGYDRRRKAYIAAQSPFNEVTICDFWRMIHQEAVANIVFISGLVEDSIVKSEQYWFEDDETHVYASISVSLLRIDRFANFVIRKFNIKKVDESSSRKVTQFQYTAWPEHGVPADPIPLLEFRTKVRASEDRVTDGSLLVHCGTGVSRTGVFIATDYCLMRANVENTVNVHSCSLAMRQCRPMMIRTLKQYIFTYDVLFEALIAQHCLIGRDVKSAYSVLMKVTPTLDHSHFRQQFKILEKYIDTPTPESCAEGLNAHNITKNRFSTVGLIARDCDRPVLKGGSITGTSRPQYINALLIDSYTQREAFIVTQTPLPHTVDGKLSVLINAVEFRVELFFTFY